MKLFILVCFLIGWTNAAPTGETIVTTYQRPAVPVPFEKYGPPPPGVAKPGFLPVVQTAYNYELPEHHLVVPIEAAIPVAETIEVRAPLESTVVVEESKPHIEGQSVSVHKESSYSYKTPEAPYQSELVDRSKIEGNEYEKVNEGANGQGAISLPQQAGHVVETSYSYDLPQQKVKEQHYSYSDNSGKAQVSVVGVSSDKTILGKPVENIVVEQPIAKVVVEESAHAIEEHPITSGQVVQTSYSYEVPEHVVVESHEGELHSKFGESGVSHTSSGKIVQSYIYDTPAIAGEIIVAPHAEHISEVGPSGQIVQSSYAYDVPEYISHAPVIPSEVVVAPYEEHIKDVGLSGQIVQSSYAYDVPEYIPHAPVIPGEVLVAPYEEHVSEVGPSGQIVQSSYAYDVPQYIPHTPVIPSEVVVAPHEEHISEVGPSGQIVQSSYAYDVPQYIPHTPVIPSEVVVAPHEEHISEVSPSGQIVQSSYAYDVPQYIPQAPIIPGEVVVTSHEAPFPAELSEIIPSHTYPSGEIVQTSFAYELPHAPGYPAQVLPEYVPHSIVIPGEAVIAPHEGALHAEVAEVVESQHYPSGDIVQTSYAYDVPAHIPHSPIYAPEHTEVAVPAYPQHAPALPAHPIELVAPFEHHPSGEIIHTSYEYAIPEHVPLAPIYTPEHPELVVSEYSPHLPVISSAVAAPQVGVFHSEVSEVVETQHYPSGEIVQSSYAYEVPEHVPHAPIYAPEHTGPVVPEYISHPPVVSDVVVASHEGGGVSEVVASHPFPSGDIVQSTYAYDIPKHAPHAVIPAFPGEFGLAPHHEEITEIITSQHIPSAEIVGTTYGYGLHHPSAYPGPVSPSGGIISGVGEVVVSQPSPVIAQYPGQQHPYYPTIGESHVHAGYYHGQYCYGTEHPVYYPGGPIYAPPYPIQPAGPIAVLPPPPHVVVEEHKPLLPTVVGAEHHIVAEQPIYHPPAQVVIEEHKPFLSGVGEEVIAVQKPISHPVIVEQPHPPTQVFIEESKPYPPKIIEAPYSAGAAIETFGPYPPEVEVVEEKTYPYPPAL